MRMIAKRYVHHKLEMGILFDAFYDTETTGLNKRFSEITQFGGLITDLAGNPLYHTDIRARVSNYTVIEPLAWIIQRMKKADLDTGDNRYHFAGKVLRFFRYASQLHQAPYAKTFLNGCRVGTYSPSKDRQERYYAYPLLNDDGSIDWDYVRIHENLKKFYFRNGENGPWVKRDIHAMTIGYNNVNADDQWIWTMAHMAGAPNIFVTHLAHENKYRLDALRLLEAAIIAGNGGSNGVFPYKQRDGRFSFSMGDIIQANTRLGAELRGLQPDLLDEEGGQIDTSQLHGAYRDAVALCALLRYVREREPDITRIMEKNTDWKKVIEHLTEEPGHFGNSPILSYVDKVYPNIDGMMVSLVGTDQYRNNPKTAVVYNLAVDPRNFHFNGKSIKDLDAKDWKILIESGRSSLGAPLKVIRAHKSPRLLEAEIGYTHNFHQGLDRSELAARQKTISNPDIQKKIMAGLRLAYPRLHGPDRLILPQPEEELFHFSTLELHDPVQKEDVQFHGGKLNKVEEMAQKARHYHMKVRTLWLSAISPDSDILLDDEPNSTAIGQFKERMKSIQDKLSRLDAPLLPTGWEEVTDRVEAHAYMISLLMTARNEFAAGHLIDPGHHFWFESQDGIRIDASNVIKWPLTKIDEARQSGNLNLIYENLKTTPLIIDRIVECLGATSLLGPEICSQLNAYKSLRQWGIPHFYGQNDRWYTRPQAMRDVHKIENNELQNQDLLALQDVCPGSWEKTMTGHPDMHALLADYKDYLKGLDAPPLDANSAPFIGLDPKSMAPALQPVYEVNRKNIIFIDVPDRYISAPSLHPRDHHSVFLIDQGRAKLPQEGQDVILRASETGRLYHFGQAKVIPTPPNGGIFTSLYDKARQAYAATGKSLPPPHRLIAIMGDGPYPLCEDAPQWEEKKQSLHLDQHLFEGLKAPALAGYTVPLSGVTIHDDALSLTPGPCLIVEYANDKPSGWLAFASVEDVIDLRASDLPKLSQHKLRRLGYTTRDQAIEEATTRFSDRQRRANSPRSRLKAIFFERMRGKDVLGQIFYHDPTRPPVSYLLP